MSRMPARGAGSQMSAARLEISPLTLKQANELVRDWHRHHKPARGHRFSIGVMDSGIYVGAAICGRPNARMTPQYDVLEINRCVTNGTPNACSKLYGTCAAIAKLMGFDSIQTAILENESGVSLKAAGFKFDHWSEGGDWNRPSRGGRRTDQPMCRKQVWVKKFKSAPASDMRGEGRER